MPTTLEHGRVVVKMGFSAQPLGGDGGGVSSSLSLFCSVYLSPPPHPPEPTPDRRCERGESV